MTVTNMIILITKLFVGNRMPKILQNIDLFAEKYIFKDIISDNLSLKRRKINLILLVWDTVYILRYNWFQNDDLLLCEVRGQKQMAT
jgi:hypothetical protein